MKDSDNSVLYSSHEIPSILSDSDDEGDSFPQGFFTLDEEAGELSASQTYIGSYDEVVRASDSDYLYRRKIYSRKNCIKIIQNGMSEEELDKIPIDKLIIMTQGRRDDDIINLLKGRSFAYCKFQGINSSDLVDMINKININKIGFFLDCSFNVSSFMHYNKSISIVDVFRLDDQFITLLLHHAFTISKFIGGNKCVTLNDIVSSGYEGVKAASTYFSCIKRNNQISFYDFIRLFRFRKDEIKNIFEIVKLYPNDGYSESPLVNLKKHVLREISNKHNRRNKDLPMLMGKCHITDSYNLLLCDILFGDNSRLITEINKQPSSRYQERGIQYIIKLYEEQSSLATRVEAGIQGMFCGFLLYYIHEVNKVLSDRVFSLDQMQDICNKNPEYLKYIFLESCLIKEKKDQFYQAVSAINKYQYFQELEVRKPDLFVGFMKFSDTLLELISSDAIAVEHIEDIYDVSIAGFEKLFKSKDVILKWNESKSNFYEKIGLSEGDLFFTDALSKKIDLLILVIWFRDEILYMYEEEIMSVKEMCDIYLKSPIILQSLLRDFHKIEALKGSGKCNSVDDIVSLFEMYGNDCFRYVDGANGSFLSPENRVSRAEVCNIANASITEENHVMQDQHYDSYKNKQVSFNETAQMFIYTACNEVVPTKTESTPPCQANTALPICSGSKHPVCNINNITKSIEAALSTALPSIKSPIQQQVSQIFR